MAKNNFNFQAKLGLETKEFKRGVRETKSLLTSLSSDFRGFAASLAAGLSIGSIFNKMKDSALELSTAMNTLKNVSSLNKDAFSSFGGNLEYVQGLADKYGQNILALTDSYAKFTAASYNTGLSLEKQKNIFEALTRAAAYYHLSADQTRDMMNAVNQMMSKGKVAAEELRRQLGNTLPGAFNLMAAAMGVSTAQLDSMMKKGEVIASEVLPKFADQLNRVTAGGNFDSLQASLNKFDNAWLTFVKNSGFEDFYKGIVDSGTWALNKVASNTNAISHLLIGALGAGFAQMVKTQSQRAYENLSIELGNMEKRLQNFQATIKHMSKQNGAYFATPVQAQGGGTYFQPSSPTVDKRGLDRIKEMNEMLLKTNRIKKQLGQTPILTDMDVKRIQVINRELASMGTSMKGVNTTWAGFKILTKTVWTTIKGIGKSLLSFGVVTAIFAAISWAIEKIMDKINEAKEVAKEIAQVGKDYNNTIQEGKDHIAQQVRQSNEYLRVIKNTNISLHTRKQTLEKLSELTGNIEIKDLNVENLKEGTKEYEKLTRAVSNWAKSMEKAHIIDIYTREAARAQVEIDKLQIRLDELSGQPLTKSVFGITGTTQSSMGAMPAWGRKTVDTDAGKEVKKINAKIKEHEKNIADARKQVSNYNSQLDKLLEEFYNEGPDNGGGGSGGSSKGIKEIFDAYNKKKRELTNQLKEGAITQQKYEEEFDKLIQQTWADASATGELKLEKLKGKKHLTEMEKWYVQLSKDSVTAMLRASTKILEDWEKETEEDFNKWFEKWQKENEEDFRKKKVVLDGIEAGEYTPKRGTRDTTFDYNKTNSDIFGEELSLTEDYIDEIKDKLEQLGDFIEKEGVKGGPMVDHFNQLNQELEKAIANASDFTQAMNLAKLREDIRALSNELGNQMWSDLKGFVGAIDGIVGAHERLNEVMEDEDSDGWDQFLATFNLLASYVDTAIGAIESLNAVMQLSTMIAKAKNAEDAITLGNTMAETSAVVANTTAKGANAAASTASAVATAADTAAAGANTAAKSGEAVANATASGAKMPFPLNLLAIAAGIAAVVAALASISKFESGGIVGGNSTKGDHNLIRANSGEMILNKAQQGTLWNMLNGKGGMGGNVNFKIRGADLVGTIENYNSRRRG